MMDLTQSAYTLMQGAAMAFAVMFVFSLLGEIFYDVINWLRRSMLKW